MKRYFALIALYLLEGYCLLRAQEPDSVVVRHRAMLKASETVDATLPSRSPYASRMDALPQSISPNAAGIQQYGKNAVNYYYGLPLIKIPLETLSCQGHEIPVWLSYSAKGNRPDDHPGWVGQGWSLHAGGMITRIINGYKDELSIDEVSRDEDYEQTGYVGGYLQKASSVQASTWRRSFYLKNNGSDIPASKKIYADYEPDEFFVDLEDLHASFYIVGPQEVAIKSAYPEEFRVIYEWNQNTVNYSFGNGIMYSGKLYGYLSSFTIVRSDGTRYCFGGDQTSIECSFVEQTGELVGTVNSWLLKEIQYTNGEIIHFSYEKDGTPLIVRDMHSCSRVTADIVIAYAGSTTNDHYVRTKVHDTHDPDDDTIYTNYYFTLLSPSYLKSITAERTGESLTFSRTRSTELGYSYDENAYNARVKTSEVIPSLSSILSHNYYMQLSKIQKSENAADVSLSFSDDPQKRLRLLSVSYKNSMESTSDYSFEYDDSNPLPLYNSRMTDMWGYYTGRSYFGASWAEQQSYRQMDSLYSQAEILKRVYYPTGGFSSYEYEPNRASYSLTDYGTLSPINVIGGGLRVKRIIDCPDSLSVPVVKDYEYLDEAGYSSGFSFPIPWFSSNYFDYSMIPFVSAVLDGLELMGLMSITYTTQTYCEAPMNEASNLSNCYVSYARVKEHLSTGESCIYTFTSQSDSLCRDWKDGFSLNIGMVPFSSNDISRGRLLTHEKIDNNGKRVEKTINRYNIDTSQFVRGYRINPEYPSWRCHEYKIISSFPSLAESGITSKTDSNDSLRVNNNYEWDSHRRLKRTLTSVVGPSNETVPSDTLVEERFYAADYEQSGFDGVDYPAMTALGMGGVPVEKVLSRDGKLVTAELTEWKYFPTSDCYLPFRRSTASPSEYAYTGGGLFRGRSRIMPYSRPENTILKYDASANPVEVYLSDGRYARYTWDAHSRLTGSFLGVKDDRMVQVDNYLEENVIEQRNLNNNASPYYICGFETSSDSLCHVGFYFIEGGAVDLWCQLDTISFRYYGPGNPSPGMVAPSLSEDFLIPAGIHTLSLSTNFSSGAYNSPPQITQPIDPEPSDGPDHPGWTEPAPGSTSAPLKGTLTLRYRGEVNHPYYEQWAQMRHFSFEGDVGDCQDRFESDCARIGSYTFSAKFDPGLSYVIDMQVKRNGAWEYERQAFQLSGGNTYTISAGGLPFDEVRIYPVDAEVETYTWWPDGNLRSRTDGRGVTESYVYDAFGRLIEVRDTDGNRMEGYDYHYATHLDMVGL